jgi:hypothetical protein
MIAQSEALDAVLFLSQSNKLILGIITQNTLN